MAAPISTVEPQKIVAGDTLKWIRSLADWPATTWTLGYRLIPLAGGTVIEIATVASGSDHSVTVTAEDTAEYVAGEYRLAAFVTDSTDTERYSLPELARSVTIVADPASATGADQRTAAEKTLANLKTAYDKLASNSVLSTTIDGKTWTMRNLDELQRAISYWTGVVRAEREATAPNSSKIYIRFQ